MNTKKFIEKVNALDSYECVYQDKKKLHFSVLNFGSRVVEFYIKDKVINFGEHYTFSSDPRRLDDIRFLRLLVNYADNEYWYMPRKKWFKK